MMNRLSLSGDDVKRETPHVCSMKHTLSQCGKANESRSEQHTFINRAHYSQINRLLGAQIKSITSILTLLYDSIVSFHPERCCGSY